MPAGDYGWTDDWGNHQGGMPKLKPEAFVPYCPKPSLGSGPYHYYWLKVVASEDGSVSLWVPAVYIPGPFIKDGGGNFYRCADSSAVANLDIVEVGPEISPPEETRSDI